MSERSGTLADNPFSGRRPTSHERRSGRPWDVSYHAGSAPWDTGRPQPAILCLGPQAGSLARFSIWAAAPARTLFPSPRWDCRFLGVDVAETALVIAREKAEDRGIEAEFAVANAFDLGRLGRTFETVLDSGLFHTFDGGERRSYVASLATVIELDGALRVVLQ